MFLMFLNKRYNIVGEIMPTFHTIIPPTFLTGMAARMWLILKYTRNNRFWSLGRTEGTPAVPSGSCTARTEFTRVSAPMIAKRFAAASLYSVAQATSVFRRGLEKLSTWIHELIFHLWICDVCTENPRSGIWNACAPPKKRLWVKQSANLHTLEQLRARALSVIC